MMRRLATTAASVAVVALLATACGDDPADDAAGAGGVASTLPSSAGAPTGSGSLLLDDVTYAFEADVCSLTPVNHQARDFEVYVHGSGENDGVEYEIEVTRTAVGQGNAIETITFDRGDGQLAAATNSTTVSGTRLDVSSTVLTGDLDFVATADDLPIGVGAVSIACS